MAVSPRRVSHSRKGMKNSHIGKRKILPTLLCSKCAALIKFHKICPCGFYRDRKIF